ncbi:MAG TPA: flagellar protein export ATPase FliI [Gammaproteobacteria bacterium]|nr:flagellar protein export ATPase FliI [Gammaproteobacteria bacterium]
MKHETILNRSHTWVEALSSYESRLSQPADLRIEGRITRLVGMTLEAAGIEAPVGSRCVVEVAQSEFVEAEVVGFAENSLFLMPTKDVKGLRPGASVFPTRRSHEAQVGAELLGRVIDGAGIPLDSLGSLDTKQRNSLTGESINPLLRAPIRQPLDVGIASINALLTVGRGQRVGLFAGSGVGKSVLLGMMTRFTEADVVVVGLIGERGREVKEFIESNLGQEGLARSVVVASPADTPPLMRMHGAMLATSIAEYFRDQGKNVLLLLDSLTRFAQAQREIGLAIGEPPATKGYPPSVFAKLPKLVERAGNGVAGGGSITAFYTVLTEGDDQQDPIADAARAILDGHIVLSRRLAERGHYPAVDVEASISRAMNDIVDKPHESAANRFRKLNSIYESNRDLISVGAYTSGSDPQIDEAIYFSPLLQEFLQQDRTQAMSLQQSTDALRQLFQTPVDTPGEG